MSNPVIRLRGWWESLQSSLWLMPAVGVVVSILLANGLILLEPLPGWVPGAFAFTGGADGARSVLAQLAGATFTVVGVVFSLTVLALQMASTQFTPRLLRNFLTDRSVQVVLTGLIASGVFHVAVLRRVRSSDGSTDAFVPELAVNAALFAALAAVGLLVYFLHHVTSQLRVDVVMIAIRRETLHQLDSLTGGRERLPDIDAPQPPADAVMIPARVSGYLQMVDMEAVVAAAAEFEVIIRLRPSVGEWVVAGTSLAWVWSPDGAGVPVDAEQLSTAVHDRIHLGADRTESGDLAFGLRQLEDIAARALSPGVNDPTTAVQAVAQLAGILVPMSDHPLGADVGHDDTGALRAVTPGADFAAYLELAVGDVRRYGTGEPSVLIAILRLLTDVAERVADSGERSAMVREQIQRTLQAMDVHDPADTSRVERVAAMALATLESGHRPATWTEAG